MPPDPASPSAAQPAAGDDSQPLPELAVAGARPGSGTGLAGAAAGPERRADWPAVLDVLGVAPLEALEADLERLRPSARTSSGCCRMPPRGGST